MNHLLNTSLYWYINQTLKHHTTIFSNRSLAHVHGVFQKFPKKSVKIHWAIIIIIIFSITNAITAYGTNEIVVFVLLPLRRVVPKTIVRPVVLYYLRNISRRLACSPLVLPVKLTRTKYDIPFIDRLHSQAPRANGFVGYELSASIFLGIEIFPFQYLRGWMAEGK